MPLLKYRGQMTPEGLLQTLTQHRNKQILQNRLNPLWKTQVVLNSKFSSVRVTLVCAVSDPSIQYIQDKCAHIQGLESLGVLMCFVQLHLIKYN